MIDIYVNKGLAVEDATEVITIMAKYEGFFVDIMMQQELELQVPEDNHVEQSMKEGMDFPSVLEKRNYALNSSRNTESICFKNLDCIITSHHFCTFLLDLISFNCNNRLCYVFLICFLWLYASFGIRYYPTFVS